MYGGFGLSMSVFLYHGFIKSVPQSLEEAAIIDGANIFQMFFKVVFLLLKGTTVTVIVLNGMWIWNDYLLPFLVIGNSNGVKTLTLELYFAKLTSGQYGNLVGADLPGCAGNDHPDCHSLYFPAEVYRGRCGRRCR